MMPILKITEENCNDLIKAYSAKVEDLDRKLDNQLSWELDTGVVEAELALAKDTLGKLNHFKELHKIA